MTEHTVRCVLCTAVYTTGTQAATRLGTGAPMAAPCLVSEVRRGQQLDSCFVENINRDFVTSLCDN